MMKKFQLAVVLVVVLVVLLSQELVSAQGGPLLGLVGKGRDDSEDGFYDPYG